MLFWNNIQKGILENSCGYLNKSELTAILGPSGAGKTTLLTEIYEAKHVYINTTKIKKKHISFVGQNEEFFDMLTVEETLLFYCNMRNVPVTEMEQILENTNLSKLRYSEIHKLSGGEKKRLSIAYELTTDKEVIILDEPTSSLDSVNALQIIECLNNIKKEKYILFSIHQPNIETFSLIDCAFFLKSGHVCYHGKPMGVLEYCNEIEIPCPQYYNPADHFMNILSDHSKVLPAVTMPENAIDPSDVILLKRSSEKCSLYKQLYYLLCRSFTDCVRQPMLFKVRIFQSIFMALIVGGLYFNLTIDGYHVTNVNGCIFFIVLNQLMASYFSVLQVFPSQLSICKQETDKNLYKVYLYYITKTLVDIPFQLIALLVFLTICLPMTMLCITTVSIVQTAAVLISGSLAISSFGYFISVFCSTRDVAVIIGNLAIFPMMLLGGFFVQNNSIPTVLEYGKYLSIFNYAYQGMMCAVYMNSDYNGFETVFSSPHAVMEYFDIEFNVTENCVYLLLMSVLFRILGLIGLIIKNYFSNTTVFMFK